MTDSSNISKLNKSYALNSGGEYIVRPIHPDDGQKLIHLFNSLSSKSRYLRFAHAMSSLPEPVLEHLLSLKSSQSNEIALVAEVPHEDTQHSKGRIVGITRCIGDPDNQRCEFSLSVSDDFHGEGVGSQLMLNMMEGAHGKGFTEVYGYVLAENQDMLQLMKHLNFKISSIDNDYDFKLVTHKV